MAGTGVRGEWPKPLSVNCQVMLALKDPRDSARRRFWGLGNWMGNRENDRSVTPGLQKASFLQMLTAAGMTFLRREASSPSP